MSPETSTAESYKPKLAAQVKADTRIEPRKDEPIIRKSTATKETASGDMFLPWMRNTLREGRCLAIASLPSPSPTTTHISIATPSAQICLRFDQKTTNSYTVDIIRFLLGHQPFAPNLSYAPVRLVNSDNTRIHNEMLTANCWWDVQKQLPPKSTVVPLIISTDKTQLTQHNGEQASWPVYLTIGNLDKATRRAQAQPSIILLQFHRNPPSTKCVLDVLHRLVMDMQMGQAYYFTRSQNFWHPYISQIYFGILYIVQVMRCEMEVSAQNTLHRLFSVRSTPRTGYEPGLSNSTLLSESYNRDRIYSSCASDRIHQSAKASLLTKPLSRFKFNRFVEMLQLNTTTAT
ncbi:hypothetical protein GJ744_003452 [Endocarpon pusillum]|uniref:Uncharacterized protein n=1 Tax=Endocarpon pusillum TaxID=364733 RepID=A0A8H7E9H3_9EURO|nr:hypothetical protein GJ744_003452 [Endocarpon pusillum]